MASRMQRWEESRQRNALREHGQPRCRDNSEGHNLFAQPGKNDLYSRPAGDPFSQNKAPISDPFARPALRLEEQREASLGRPRLKRPEIKVSNPPGGETSWAISDAGTSQRAAHPAARQYVEDPNSKEAYRRDIEAQIRAGEDRRAAEQHGRRRGDAEDDQRVERERAAMRREVEEEIAQQRRREQLVQDRSDHLESYLGQNGAPPRRQENEAYASRTHQRGPVSGTTSYGGANGNGNQNVGNCIGDRPSCRVLQPPGGRSSITFG